MKKKAVLVVSALRGGGAEKFVLNLYQALEKHQNYECHIIAIEKSVEYNIDGFRVHFASDICNVSKKGWRRLFYKKKVSKAIDNFILKNIDSSALILSNMLLSDKIMSYSKLNVFHVIHNSYTTSLLQGKNLLNRLRVIIKTNNLYKNHPLVFVSNAAKESYLKSFKTTKKSCVIYNPINVKDIQELSGCYDVDIGSPYIIHIGRFNRAKRHDRLINIFKDLNNKDISLVLLGDGELKEGIKKKVHYNHLENRVLFLGFKSNPYPYLKKAKALVLTSDFEGLPTVLLEALSLNVPVISMECPGGISEIIRGNSKSLCPLGDDKLFSNKIDDVINNPIDYTSDVHECFLPNNVAEKYSQLL